MRQLAAILLCFCGALSSAQHWEIRHHPNSRKLSVNHQGKTTDFVFSEVSELQEGKAFVAQGDLYAFMDEEFNILTPYMFAQISNFKQGFAMIGDSTSQGVLNHKMHVVIPMEYQRIRFAKMGLILVQSHDGLWGVYDVFGNHLIPEIYDLPPKILNLEQIIVRKQDRYGLVNSCNETIFNCSYQYIHKSGFAFKQGKYLRLFQNFSQ